MDNLNVSNIMVKPPQPAIIDVRQIGFDFTYTGNKTKVCLISSGATEHDAIVNVGDCINFTESKTPNDVIGYSTILSGLIVGNKPDFIQGIATDASIFFAKATGDDGGIAFDAVVASILWGVIKEVNVIVIPFVIESHHTGLQEAVNKAHESNICVVMASNDAKYENTLSVSSLQTGQAHFTGPGIISSPSCGFVSTYLDNQYATVSGNAVAAAIVAGACLLAYEKCDSQSVFSVLANSLKG